jgi:hypothetical protein
VCRAKIYACIRLPNSATVGALRTAHNVPLTDLPPAEATPPRSLRRRAAGPVPSEGGRTWTRNAKRNAFKQHGLDQVKSKLACLRHNVVVGRADQVSQSGSPRRQEVRRLNKKAGDEIRRLQQSIHRRRWHAPPVRVGCNAMAGRKCHPNSFAPAGIRFQGADIGENVREIEMNLKVFGSGIGLCAD